MRADGLASAEGPMDEALVTVRFAAEWKRAVSASKSFRLTDISDRGTWCPAQTIAVGVMREPHGGAVGSLEH
jgi:hypothetical protein